MQTLLWSKPFSRLKRSYDDGSEQLYLEFGKLGMEAVELLVGVDEAVIKMCNEVIHNCNACKFNLPLLSIHRPSS